MDRQKIVDEIVRLVEEMLNGRKLGGAEEPDVGIKNRVLIVTRYSDEACKNLAERLGRVPDLQADFSYDMYQNCDLNIYSEIVVKHLDSENLSKVAEGLFLNSYLRLISKGLLMGKRITVIEEDLDNFAYKDSMPPKYLELLDRKLSKLKEWGIAVSREQDVAMRLTCKFGRGNEVRLEKRIVTYKDVSKAFEEGHRTITVFKNTIVTDIAKEFASKNGVEIISE